MNVTLKITDDFSGGWLKNHPNIYTYYKDKQTLFLIYKKKKHIGGGFKKKRQTSGKLGKQNVLPLNDVNFLRIKLFGPFLETSLTNAT